MSHTPEAEMYYDRILALYFHLHPEELEHVSYYTFEGDDHPVAVMPADAIRRLTDWAKCP